MDRLSASFIRFENFLISLHKNLIDTSGVEEIFLFEL
jgi:hypothetical protein